jgi:glycerophosphoryl diester phosphodiesterase
MVELDVRLSADAVPLVIHDATLRRTTGRPGSVCQRTARYIRSLDAGSWFDPAYSDQRIPTLEEALAFLCPQVPVNVEMKFRRREPVEPLARAVADVLADLGWASRVLVSSFRHEALPLVSQRLADLAVAPLFAPGLTGPPDASTWSWLLDQPQGEEPWRGRVLVLYKGLVDEALLERLRRCDGRALVWTVDEPEEMRRLAALGVDGIISNRPGLLARVLGA